MWSRGVLLLEFARGCVFSTISTSLIVMKPFKGGFITLGCGNVENTPPFSGLDFWDLKSYPLSDNFYPFCFN